MIDIVVIGTGNIFLGDDGVGIHFIDYLREKNILPEYVTLIDSGIDAFEITNYLLDSKRAIILDACDFGENSPGSLKIIDVNCAKLSKSEKGMSIHSRSVKDAILLASSIRKDLSILIYAIQVESISPKIGISTAIRRNYSLFESQLLNDIKKFKEEVFNEQKNTCCR